MSDDNERLFGLPNEPADINWRNDLKSITADDTRQRLEAYWWHLYGMRRHKADAECGGRAYHSHTSSETGALVCHDITDLAIQLMGAQPIESPPERVCLLGGSKGEAGVGCQEEST